MRVLYFIIACIFMLLGMIGVILPILPTTPFLLVSAYCFAKSSERFHQWFIHTSLYRNHLESFVNNREMTKKTKVRLLLFASTMLLFAMYFMNSIHVRIVLFALMIFKYYYFIFRIKTIS